MIMADKIIALRKRAGWSQEELAQQLGVTRQSVSKWEGAQSVPDMDKVLQMSRLFGVSTDYLLKDELEETEALPTAEEPALRRVTMEQASDYLALRRAAAPRVALATFLCILSPAVLLLLSGMSGDARFAVRGDTAAGIGLCVLLVLVAAAVALFITSGTKSKVYEFLEKEPFETEYGVAGMVKERKAGVCAHRHAAERHRHGAVHPVGAAAVRVCGLPGRGSGVHRGGLRPADAGGPGLHRLRVRGRGDGGHGQAAGGGGLYPGQKGQERHHHRRQRLLLAGDHGGVHDLHLRPPGQRPAPEQLDHLGGGGRAVRRGDAAAADHPHRAAGQIRRDVRHIQEKRRRSRLFFHAAAGGRTIRQPRAKRSGREAELPSRVDTKEFTCPLPQT